MAKIFKVILLAVVLFVTITVVSFVYLKWWVALLIVLAMIVAMLLGLRYLIANIGKIFGKAMLKVFEVKSKVLRGATAQVNSVQPTTAPPVKEGEEPPKDPANYYRIDATIKPAPSDGPMQHWDLDDLQLVPFDTPATSLEKMADEGKESVDGYPLCETKVMQDGAFVDDTAGKYQGDQQVQALVAVPPHVRELKFQYYAEQFGRITLPQPLPKLG